MFNILLLESIVSSCNIPSILLAVMDSAPRPLSPSAREAIQKALQRENTEQLSKRDAHILGLDIMDGNDERAQLDSFCSNVAIMEGKK